VTFVRAGCIYAIKIAIRTLLFVAKLVRVFFLEASIIAPVLFSLTVLDAATR
jgi:hypothetical protein